MAKRVIYYVSGNNLAYKELDYSIPAEITKEQQDSIADSMLEAGLDLPQPCVNVASKHGHGNSLSMYNVKLNNVKPIKDVWQELYTCGKGQASPPGMYEILYMKALTEEQAIKILSAGSFYDIYYNPDSDKGSVAKACAMFQLLSKQGNLEYITESDKFLWWFLLNQQYAVPYEAVNLNK